MCLIKLDAAFYQRLLGKQFFSLLNMAQWCGFLPYPFNFQQRHGKGKKIIQKVLKILNTAIGLTMIGTVLICCLSLYIFYPHYMYEEDYPPVLNIAYHLENWLKLLTVFIAFLHAQTGEAYFRETVDSLVQVMLLYDQAWRIESVLVSAATVSKRLLVVFLIDDLTIVTGLYFIIEPMPATLVNLCYIPPFIAIVVCVLHYNALFATISGIVRCLNDTLYAITVEEKKRQRSCSERRRKCYNKRNVKGRPKRSSHVNITTIEKLVRLHKVLTHLTWKTNDHYGVVLVIVMLYAFIQVSVILAELYFDTYDLPAVFIAICITHAATYFLFFVIIAYANHAFQRENERTILLLHEFNCWWNSELNGMVGLKSYAVLSVPFLMHYLNADQVLAFKIPLSIKLMFYLQALLQTGTIGYVLMVHHFRASFHRFYFVRLVCVLEQFGRRDISKCLYSVQTNIHRLLIASLLLVLLIISAFLIRDHSWGNLLKVAIFLTTQLMATSLTLQYLSVFGVVSILLRQMNDTLEVILYGGTVVYEKNTSRSQSRLRTSPVCLTCVDEHTIEKIRRLQLQLLQIVLHINGGAYGGLLIVVLLTTFIFLNTELLQLYQGMKASAFTFDVFGTKLTNSALKFAMMIVYALSNRSIQSQLVTTMDPVKPDTTFYHNLLIKKFHLLLNIAQFVGFLPFPSYVLRQDVERQQFRTPVLTCLNATFAVLVFCTSFVCYLAMYIYYPDLMYKENLPAVLQIMYHVENWLRVVMVLIALAGPRLSGRYFRETIDTLVHIMKLFDRAAKIDSILGSVSIVTNRLLLLYSTHTLIITVTVWISTEHPVSTLLNVSYLAPYVTIAVYILLYQALLTSVAGMVGCLNDSLHQITLQDTIDVRQTYEKHTTISYIQLQDAKHRELQHSHVDVATIEKLSTLHMALMRLARSTNKHFGVLMLIILLSTFIQINMLLLELYHNISKPVLPAYCLWILFLHAIVHFTFFFVIAKSNHSIEQEMAWNDTEIDRLRHQLRHNIGTTVRLAQCLSLAPYPLSLFQGNYSMRSVRLRILIGFRYTFSILVTIATVTAQFVMFYYFPYVMYQPKVPIFIVILYYIVSILQTMTTGNMMIVCDHRRSEYEGYFQEVLQLIKETEHQSDCKTTIMYRNIAKALLVLYCIAALTVPTVMAMVLWDIATIPYVVAQTVPFVVSFLILNQYFSVFIHLTSILRKMNERLASLVSMLPAPEQDRMRAKPLVYNVFGQSVESLKTESSRLEQIEQLRILHVRTVQTAGNLSEKFGIVIILIAVAAFASVNIELLEFYQCIKLGTLTPSLILMKFIYAVTKFSFYILIAYPNRLIQKEIEHFVSQISNLHDVHQACGMITLDMKLISNVKSEMADLGAPVRVSPLIRFGRWSFLVVGVAYGAYHQQRLASREVGIREIEAKQKVIRDAKLAEEKKRNQEAEAKAIAELSLPTKKINGNAAHVAHVGATNGTKITLNATQLYAVLDAMEQDEEQVPDIREQMFHNTVREHIVSII
uniref:ATP synthase F(0) complex subunit e, mitochondrial n=1 Tax=Anopheles christyi TaxID=43041 RepID=A0A182K2A3_9DIPT